MNFKRYARWIAAHQKRIGLIAGLVTMLFVVPLSANYLFIGSYGKYIVDQQTLGQKLDTTEPVAIVFGGGIESGKPRPILKDRLDTAAALIAAGTVSKLVVSGDNRFIEYNEPQAMKRYLVEEKQIDPTMIQLDNAGRSTYETCERAAKIFSISKVALVSESTHLPRAIYTCRSFGVEAYGYKSDGKSSAGLRVGQRFREILARTKATLNIYVVGEKTILGEKITL